MTVSDFVKKNKNIFWSINNYDSLSDEAVVEGILNYGDMKQVNEIIQIIGIKETAKIFRNQVNKSRTNYRPEIKNYFQLYFNKYA